MTQLVRRPGDLVVNAVRGLTPYVPGKPISELQRELGINSIEKLASNENPWGPSPAALSAMREALDEVWLYPDGSGHDLRSALSRHLQVPMEWLTLGNGSNELLVLLSEAFLERGLAGICSQYAFAIYPLAIRATGADCIEVPALPASAAMPLGHDLVGLRGAITAATRLVFIANPNNPTGTWLDPAQLLAFIDSVPVNTLVVLDEAYLEYGRELGCVDAIEWVRTRPHLVLLRTFSKAYGLAGARVGYAVSHPEVADAMNRLRPAFNVNSLAMAGAIAALADQQHMRRCVAQTIAELQRVREALLSLGLAVIPSAGNFLLVRFGDGAAKLYEQLLRGGVIVRPVAGYGLPQYLRISIGKPAQNERVLQLLRQWRAATS